MTTTWVRRWFQGGNQNQTADRIAALSAGDTLERVHFGWGFQGVTSTLAQSYATFNNLFTFGLVTTIGDGTETVPSPKNAPGDADPPTQRWLYWEARSPRVAAWDGASETVLWGDGPRPESSDTKGQVLATGLGAGQTLNLWATWQSLNAWDASGSAQVWYFASALVRSP